WSLRRPVYGLRQAPREWYDTLRTTLAALGFAPSTADPSLFLRTDTTLPPFYVLVYVDDLVFATADTKALTHVLQRFGFTYSSPQSTPLPTGHMLSAPPSDESVEPSGSYPELVGFLMYLMTCTRPDLAYPLSLLARYVAPGRHRKVHWDAAKRVLRYLCSTSGMGLVLGGRARVVLTGHADASWVDDLATQRSSQGYTFNLGSGSVSWRSTRSSYVLSSSCEAEIYAGAMAAQELRWLTYLLADLGEAPHSPPVLYVDNKAMLALCHEHRLEHRTKHIALRYFLARELQQRGQLRLAYVASQANIADVFTKALQPCDHQPCFAFLDWSCDLLFSPTLPMGFMVPEQQRGRKLVPKARWGLHLGMLPDSKGWEVLDLTSNKVVTSVEVIFYETLSLEVWKAKYGPASGWTQAHPPTDTSTATVPLLAEVDERVDEDVVEVLPPPNVLDPPTFIADQPASTPVSATGDEGSLEALLAAPASGIAGGRQSAKLVDHDRKPSTTGEQQTVEPVELEAGASVVGRGAVEVLIEMPELQRTGQTQKPPERLVLHAYLPPAAFTTVYENADDDLLYDDANDDVDLPKLDPDVHTDPRDIATMTVKEALASWKGEAVKAAMDEEIRSLIGMGTWELVERSRGVNIMKNRWVLTTKYRIDNTIKGEKARLVVKGFTQVYGADYDETYSPVSSHVTLRIFLSIDVVLNLSVSCHSRGVTRTAAE
ncbi:unnamed protein product, partial [Closterium sp. NIES-53]